MRSRRLHQSQSNYIRWVFMPLDDIRGDDCSHVSVKHDTKKFQQESSRKIYIRELELRLQALITSQTAAS
ncbi:hypothetical protein F2P81_012279 [Scophthalmus maximus]|uniref:Uncharacterized protein n=1 Tax=Scophthalmus maximus TaxID=52904 RepID=A0A6A4SU04_SCOMX|nr:hypothetical protein F2P81_012279 [Scophthalmus maximus]